MSIVFDFVNEKFDCPRFFLASARSIWSSGITELVNLSLTLFSHAIFLYAGYLNHEFCFDWFFFVYSHLWNANLVRFVYTESMTMWLYRSKCDVKVHIQMPFACISISFSVFFKWLIWKWVIQSMHLNDWWELISRSELKHQYHDN